jgi:hypothetical protein
MSSRRSRPLLERCAQILERLAAHLSGKRTPDVIREIAHGSRLCRRSVRRFYVHHLTFTEVSATLGGDGNSGMLLLAASLRSGSFR